jgi:hypothetical protein
MTVVRFPRGRQPRHVELARDLRDDLVAVADDGRDFAGAVLRLARIAQLQLAAERSPATTLDALERLAARHQTAMTALGARARETRICPDVEGRAIGHGEAA